MIDYASDCLLGFYAICVFVVLKFEGVLNGALCLCEEESLLFWNHVKKGQTSLWFFNAGSPK